MSTSGSVSNKTVTDLGASDGRSIEGFVDRIERLEVLKDSAFVYCQNWGLTPI